MDSRESDDKVCLIHVVKLARGFFKLAILQCVICLNLLVVN